MKKKCFYLFVEKLLLLLVFLISTTSCSKDKEIVHVDIKDGSRIELITDSLFFYAKEIYLWNDALPSYNYFQPRKKFAFINPEISALKAELLAITHFKINDNTNLPFEYTDYETPKYSFLESHKPVEQRYPASFKNSSSKKSLSWVSKELAYVYVESFPNLYSIQKELDETFLQIALNSPSNIVIDLRNNAGGQIETVEYFANLLIPSRLNGNVMFTEVFNNNLQSRNIHMLRHQVYKDQDGNAVMINGRKATLADVDYSEKGNTYFFKKKGGFENLSKIYFITSNRTASASELLISLLKPYFHVKLVGEKTYGKPVGFFPIEIDKYTIYLSSFILKNSLGWFDYFDGIVPDIYVKNPMNPELGDLNEPCLKSVLIDLDVNNAMLKKNGIVHKKNNIGLETKSKDNILIESRLKLQESLN